MTVSTQTLLRRIEALEARLADVEGGFSRTIYALERRSVRADLALDKIMGHLRIEPPSDDEVDAVLDAR